MEVSPLAPGAHTSLNKAAPGERVPPRWRPVRSLPAGGPGRRAAR